VVGPLVGEYDGGLVGSLVGALDGGPVGGLVERLVGCEAKVLVVLLTEAFFLSIPCLNEVYAAIKKGDVYMIRIRVDSGGCNISRDKEKMWPIDVIGDDEDLELKRFVVLDKLAVLNTLPERGTLLSAREYTLDQLDKVVRLYV
jgi:hypothetical protein